MENNERKLIGRKLILDWGKIKLEIVKLPNVVKGKDPIFDLYESEVLLANVYENANGQLEDEILGKPAGPNGDCSCIEGMRVENYATDNCFWKTTGEVQQ